MNGSGLAHIARRSAWFDALLAALATVSVALPITTVLRTNDWLWTAVVVVSAIAVAGIILRALRTPPTLVVLIQAAVWLASMLWLFLPDTLWYGLPTTASVDVIGAHLAEAASTLQTYAAPAPVNDGVAFMVVALVGLTALSVDSIAVTGNAPAVAGVPLAAAFMVPVSNSGAALPVHFFILSAMLWLALVAAQHIRTIGAWSSLRLRVGEIQWGQRGLAAAISSVVVAAAVGAALAVPHLPPTFLADGLGRNEQGNRIGGGDGGHGSVSFAETMDLSQDLASQSTDPVLRYTTDARRPAPLRVTASSEFSNGVWQAPQYGDRDRGSGVFSIPTEPPQSSWSNTAQISVVENSMEPPFLAVPDLAISADLGVGWRYDADTAALRVEATPDRYTTTYLATDLQDIDPAEMGEGPTSGDVSSAYLRLDPVSADRITAMAAELTDGTSSQLGAANAIQAHLRSSAYTYSLTLAPGVEDSDPITHFLDTRRGYCTQFATAMVMMARAEGIPARMAVGFLPGDLSPDGTRTVLANDAHAWPELYLDNLGWTRFEPTPGARSGIPPQYSLGNPDADPTEPTSPTETTTPTPTPVEPEDPELPQEQPSAQGAGDGPSWFSQVLPFVLITLGVVAVLAALLAVFAWGGARYREAELRRARTSTDTIEGAWVMLQRCLADLGIPAPPRRSPRQMYDFYRAHTSLGTGGQDRLRRMTDRLERVRYAEPTDAGGLVGSMTPSADDLRADVRAISAEVAGSLSGRTRMRARLLPPSGRAHLRAVLARGDGMPSEDATTPADTDAALSRDQPARR